MEFAREVCKFLTPPFVVVSETQTSGYGQYGRVWESPIGGLWFTEVMNIPEKTAFSLFLSLPILRVLKSLNVEGVSVKWPNDIYLEGKKLAGILTRIKGDTVFTGIGINVENSVPFSVSNVATTLKGKINISVPVLLEKILKTQSLMMEDYLKFGFKPFVKTYEENLIFLNKPVIVRSKAVFSGVVRGVNERGNLILKTHSGILTIESGTIIEF